MRVDFSPSAGRHAIKGAGGKCLTANARIYSEAGIGTAYLNHHLLDQYLNEKASSC
jgi:hypothetical protein